LTVSQNNLDEVAERFKGKYKCEYVYNFENNYAVFKTFEKKMGVIDTSGTIIISPIFAFIHNNKKLKNLFEVGNKVDNKFKRGFINLQGAVVIPIVYDFVFYFGNDVISVAKNGKIGVVNTLNTIILPVEFDNISIDNNLLIGQKDGTLQLYDMQGKKINDLQFTEISKFKDNHAIVGFADKTSAVIDINGAIVLKSLENYNFKILFDDKLYLIINNSTSKFGVVDSNNKLIIDTNYDEIRQFGSMFIADKNGKKGFVSRSDSIIKPFLYDEIFSGYKGRSGLPKKGNVIVKKNKLYGIVDPNVENEVIEINYKQITNFNTNYYIVENVEGRNGLFNYNGEVILNEIYKFYNVYKNFIFATKNEKQYIIQVENGKKYIEEEVAVDEFVDFIDVVKYESCGNQIVKKEDRFGVINHLNKIIIPCEYEMIQNIYMSSEFIVKKKGKCGIINPDNQIVVAIEFDRYKILKESILLSKKNSKIEKFHPKVFPKYIDERLY
jgi:hypothetical protein